MAVQGMANWSQTWSRNVENWSGVDEVLVRDWSVKAKKIDQVLVRFWPSVGQQIIGQGVGQVLVKYWSGNVLASDWSWNDIK